MAKRRKQPRSLPKRILGVRVPKALRRAADTPLGSSIMAQLLISAGRAGLQSQAVQGLRDNATLMLNNLASTVTQAAQAATQPSPAPETGSLPRRNRRAPDTEIDDRPH